MSLEEAAMDAIERSQHRTRRSGISTIERLEYLRAMAPTAEIERDLESAESDRVKAWHLTRLEDARERDQLQAQRPAGCLCLGAGMLTKNTPCSCVEGIAAAVKIRQKNQQEKAERIAALIERAEIPKRYLNAHLDDAPEAVKGWDGEGSLMLHGPYGSGKTSLAIGCLLELIHEHERGGLFITTAALLDRIKATFDKGSDADKRILTRVEECTVLVLDDLGAERMTEWVEERLYALINARYNAERATIITTNLKPSELADHIGERTAWRVAEMCELVKVEGRNWRA